MEIQGRPLEEIFDVDVLANNTNHTVSRGSLLKKALLDVHSAVTSNPLYFKKNQPELVRISNQYVQYNVQEEGTAELNSTAYSIQLRGREIFGGTLSGTDRRHLELQGTNCIIL